MLYGLLQRALVAGKVQRAQQARGVFAHFGPGVCEQRAQIGAFLSGIQVFFDPLALCERAQLRKRGLRVLPPNRLPQLVQPRCRQGRAGAAARRRPPGLHASPAAERISRSTACVPSALGSAFMAAR